MTIEEMNTEYEHTFHVLTAWNAAGVALVFESKEALDEMKEAYEDFRVAFSLPWVTSKQAVRGEDVLGMWNEGHRPWKVVLTQDGKISNVKAIPLHHVTMTLVTERYSNGSPREMEVWAPEELHARIYIQDMLREYPPLSSPDDDVEFIAEESLHKEPQAEKPAAAVPEPSFIPGFGPVLKLSEL